MASIDHKKLIITKTTNPLPHPEKSKLVWGHQFTDHMLECDWTAENGWVAPKISPRAPFQMDPASSVFHYAIEAFEGFKVYRDPEGKLCMFRPMSNMERLNRSALRVGLPAFNGREFLECVKELIKLDQSWVPEGKGYSLYIRPTYISTYPVVGVTISRAAKLYVIMSPVGPYYATGWHAVKLLTSDGYCRAFPGGTGNVKIGGNYALSLVPQREAADKGYQQVLWLFNDKLTEVGTMNFMLFWTNKQGERELITCPLTDMILPGITRDSCLKLARSWNEFKVSEKDYTISEVVEALNEGRVLEAFGTGTAAIVSPVCAIAHKGKEYAIPLDPQNQSSQIGPLAQRLYNELSKIQYGEVKSEWTEYV